MFVIKYIFFGFSSHLKNNALAGKECKIQLPKLKDIKNGFSGAIPGNIFGLFQTFLLRFLKPLQLKFYQKFLLWFSHWLLQNILQWLLQGFIPGFFRKFLGLPSFAFWDSFCKFLFRFIQESFYQKSDKTILEISFEHEIELWIPPVYLSGIFQKFQLWFIRGFFPRFVHGFLHEFL